MNDFKSIARLLLAVRTCEDQRSTNFGNYQI